MSTDGSRADISDVLSQRMSDTEVRDHRRPMDEAFGITDAPTAFAGITHDKLSLRVEGQMSLERAWPRGGQSGVSYLCFAGKVATLAPRRLPYRDVLQRAVQPKQ